ncbi:MAG TPA: kelch repeat-containing protein, partial [Polyangiaceae bacterium]|nr:kelch repeat-containing protein [Polyangiaceae bacterium]
MSRSLMSALSRSALSRSALSRSALSRSALALALLGAACSRLPDDELLEGKACESDADCVGSYRCDTSLNVCVRGPAAPGDGSGVAGSDGSSGSSGEAGGSGTGGSGGTSGGVGGGAPDDPNGSPSGGSGGSTGDPSNAGGGCDESCTGDRACLGDVCAARWLPIAASPAELVARTKPAFAVGNGKLFIWGGADAAGVDSNSGAIYDLAQDRWEPVPITETTPTARTLANAAWTGSGWLVWGGRLNAGDGEYRNGAIYDPATGVWTTLPTAGSAR